MTSLPLLCEWVSEIVPGHQPVWVTWPPVLYRSIMRILLGVVEKKDMSISEELIESFECEWWLELSREEEGRKWETLIRDSCGRGKRERRKFTSYQENSYVRRLLHADNCVFYRVLICHIPLPFVMCETAIVQEKANLILKCILLLYKQFRKHTYISTLSSHW